MTVTGADKENAGFSERIRTQINPPHAPFASVKVARISKRWGVGGVSERGCNRQVVGNVLSQSAGGS